MYEDADGKMASGQMNLAIPKGETMCPGGYFEVNLHHRPPGPCNCGGPPFMDPFGQIVPPHKDFLTDGRFVECNGCPPGLNAPNRPKRSKLKKY